MLILAILVGGCALPRAENFVVAGSDVKATLTGKVLRVELPYESDGPDEVRVTLKILAADDSVQGRLVVKDAKVKSGKNLLDFSIPYRGKAEDLFLCRLSVRVDRYREVFALSEVMDFLEIRVLGSNEFIAGSKGSIRVLVLNHRQARPVANALVKVTLASEKAKQNLFTGRTNRDGTADISFTVPREFEGSATLGVKVDAPLGSQEVEESIKIKTGYTVYLTTDKPIYQPSQLVHIRTLSLEKPDLVPVAKRRLVLEIEDLKGNKVFKRNLTTDQFGVAFADFLLADEVNFGDYKISATLGNEVAEKTVNVKKYVLPKFEVKFATEKDFYLPGEKVAGTVAANYFFGKPVALGSVVISVKKFDIGFEEVGRITGKTDKDGNYQFEYDLPKYFTGVPFEQGNAYVRFDLEVTDGAEHLEKKTEMRKVAKDPIVVSAILEGNLVKPGLKNRLLLLTSYPDGKPAVTSIVIKHGKVEKRFSTDEYGRVDYEFVGGKGKSHFTIDVKDRKGSTGKIERDFDGLDGDALMLRTSSALYKVGQQLGVRVYATKKKGRCYLDLIRNNQTVLTRSFDIANGEGNYTLALSHDLSGTLWLRAYMVTPGSDIIRDSRVIYVDPANDLSIAITPNKGTFKPGEEGWIDFVVKNRDNLPVVSALGIAIVDEAVFALSEMRPGLEKVFFLLEEEIMHPRYEIHGFDPLLVTKQARPAEFLFAQAEPKTEFAVDINTYANNNTRLIEAYGDRISNDYYKVSNAINQFYSKHNGYPKKEDGVDILYNEGFLRRRDMLDPWGTAYEITLEDWGGYQALSYGPDKKKGTADDMTPQLVWEKRRWGRGEMEAMDEAMPVAGAAQKAARAPMAKPATVATKKDGNGGGEEPRVREYFPETMLFEPAVITDATGRAKLSLKWPDSITRWRLSMMASSRKGELGSKDQGIVVFQDFFIDIDLPVSLTDGDEVSIPVALYNYLPKAQTIKLVLEEADWFDLQDEAEITRTLQKDEVSVVYYRIKVNEIGYHKMTVKAYGVTMSDAISRSVEVIPDGKEIKAIISDRLEKDVSRTIEIPAYAIADASNIYVKIFPGVFSQIVEGLDKMLGMPFGCFEQTSSVTYPNILILDYLRQTKQITPEVEMRTEEYISIGYQRLLSFEVKGGGFSWFGDAPANKILTAYGVMEFADMSKVYEIDERVNERTKNWLLSQQEKNGSWKPDASYLHEESWGRIQHNELLPTAYIAYALQHAGFKDPAIGRAVDYIKSNLRSATDPYVLALCANALVLSNREDPATHECFKKLLELKQEDNGAVYWSSKIPTFTDARGKSADIEATALIAYALIKYKKYSDVTTKVLTYIIRGKDPNGAWYSTQGTILALKALLAAMGGVKEEIACSVVVKLNGEKVETIKITSEDYDVVRLIDMKGKVKGKTNTVELLLTGEGGVLYEIATRYYVPWKLVPPPVKPLLGIDLKFDKTTMAKNDLVKCNVRVTNNKPGEAQMVIVDLGIPPGFEVITTDLDELVGKVIQKYSLTPRQIIIYFDKVNSVRPIQFAYQMKAKFPLRAKTFTSRVYEYYNPDTGDMIRPVEMVVK